ncbi:MAG: O-antigen ligase family protein [Chloroflexi bacterium]|uniref:O-antigen ligase family protein n=1 Tax=Candidatus Flexifilum breve TaxID=3140694 RepID=UPI003135D02D|nr:O-antigen ligase family protein [Chloroflexota bacterium]
MTTTRSRHSVLWGMLALLFGMASALFPAPISGAGLALAALITCIVITPYAGLVFLLVFAPLRTLIATEAPVQLPLDIGQLSLILLIGVWASAALVNHRRLPRIRWTPIYLPVIGFFAAASLSAFSAWSMSAWLNEWLKWAQILLLIAIVYDLGQQKQGREWIVFALTVAGIGNALIGIYEYFGGSGALHLLVNGNHFRAFGTFGQPNPFGGFMGLLAPLALMSAGGYGLRLWRKGRREPIALADIVPVAFYGIAFGLMAIGVYVSVSRGAWLAFAASLGMMAFALPRRTGYGLGLIVVGAALGVFLWTTGRVPASIVARINSFTQETFAISDVRGVTITAENYAVIERLAHWQAAVNMATANPLLGVGFGNYEAAYPAYSLMNWELALGHAHNYYLNVLAETGMIGLLSYVALWVMIGWITWRVRRHPDQLSRFTAVGLLGTWVYLAVHSFTDNLWVNNLFMHMGVMLGILALLQHEVRGQENLGL